MTNMDKSAHAGKNEIVWPVFKPTSSDLGLGTKEMMSPEQTLIEFISTSAGLHGVKQISLRSLEWDLLKVFPYNIMPANAAAWYMAKRKFYADQPQNQQLLAIILNKYPEKFRVNKFKVDFLETYSKETAKRKLNFLVEFGLDAYFSHKVDTYGVYFFDPSYYENTEPFHEALRLCTEGIRDRFVCSYFKKLKNKYNFVSHSHNLVSLTKDFKTKVITRTTGVIVSMVNNQYGYIKFGSGDKALFCAKSLFRDGWHYTGDPLRLPAMYFDAYRVPDGVGTVDERCDWLAMLVWCGRKPAPKFYSSLADFNITPAGGASRFTSSSEPLNQGRKRQPSSSMMIGTVVSIRKNGAVVADVQGEVFVPGWSKENLERPGVWLNTLSGETIGLNDLVAYYIDSSQKNIEGFRAVGKNVFVLKKKEDGGPSKRNSRASLPLSEGANYEPFYSEADSDDLTDNSDCESESEGDAVSDGELEWLEKDLEDIIGHEQLEAKTRPLLLDLKKDLNNVRATRSKSKTPTRKRHDSGIGTSNPTTPRDNGPLKVGKRSGDSSVFWRTNAALASIQEGYRSSDDEDYESGDEVHSFNSIVSPMRKRRQSTMSSTSNRSRKQRGRQNSTNDDGQSPALPYWIKAISLPEEFDQESGKFVPIDRNYSEDKDPDYVLPLTDDEDTFEDEQIGEKSEDNVEDNGEAKDCKDDEICTKDGDSKPGENEKSEDSQKLVEECLDEELKMLLKEAEEELAEDLLEGKHREGEAKLETPEKIVVTKPESEGDADDSIVEIITVPEPTRKFPLKNPANYLKFLENLQVDMPEEPDANDTEYVPPAVIFDSDCDYDEYDPDEDIPIEEVQAIQKEQQQINSDSVDMSKAANIIPIWYHVLSVQERKDAAIDEIQKREKQRLAKEEALKAAQEKIASESSESGDASGNSKKLSLKGLEVTVKELGTYDPKPQRKLSAGKKKKSVSEAEKKSDQEQTEGSPKAVAASASPQAEMAS